MLNNWNSCIEQYKLQPYFEALLFFIIFQSFFFPFLLLYKKYFFHSCICIVLLQEMLKPIVTAHPCPLCCTVQFWGRGWDVSGWAGGAVEREETLRGNLLKWLQQIPGGEESAGLCTMADEQQKERVSAVKVLREKTPNYIITSVLSGKYTTEKTIIRLYWCTDVLISR